MLGISAMTRSLSFNGAAEKIASSQSHSTGRLLCVVFVLYVVCQVQLFVNRRGSVNIADVLSEIQRASQRITDMELSLLKVERTLDVIFADKPVQRTDRSRGKRQTASSIRQEIRQLKRDLRRLDSRVQCVMSDNGTDSKGNPCPAGGPGKMGFLKSRKKGQPGDRISPTQKRKDKKNKAQSRENVGTPSSQKSSQTSAKKVKRKKESTVYMHWGSSKCPNTSETTLVYSGRVTSSHSDMNGGGSEFLCFPEIPIYTTPRNISRDSVHMFPVKYGKNMNVFRKIMPEDIGRIPYESFKELMKLPGMNKTLDNLYVPCAMCKSERRTTAIVVPARNVCYPYWRKEYQGYLMSQQRGTKSQFICVDADAEGLPAGRDSDSVSPLLQPAAYKCQGYSWCSSDSYTSTKALTCVVCTI